MTSPYLDRPLKTPADFERELLDIKREMAETHVEKLKASNAELVQWLKIMTDEFEHCVEDFRDRGRRYHGFTTTISKARTIIAKAQDKAHD